MFSYNFTSKLFESFSILRWTDYIRPMEFVEIDKHTLKAALIYIIGKEYETKTGKSLNWERIVKGNILALFKKIATSDIKSTLHAKIKADGREDLNKFILKVWYNGSDPKYFPNDTLSKADFSEYLRRTSVLDPGNKVEDIIVYFAHKYVTRREFEIIRVLNEDIPDLGEADIRTSYAINVSQNTFYKKDKILSDILAQITGKYDYSNKDSKKNSALFDLYTYFETLRPQTRWSQTCRIPPTSVLGHSMYVATLTYFASLELKLKEQQVVDNFFTALFHDLPESFTRDVISPVKSNIAGLQKLLEKFEAEMVEKRIIEKVKDKKWCEEFKFLIGFDDATESTDCKIDAFTERSAVCANGRKTSISGPLIKYMDRIAAFMEAKTSITTGINSYELQKGLRYTQNALKNKKYPEIKVDNQEQLSMNDFFASIPHYNIGEEENEKKYSQKNQKLRLPRERQSKTL